MKKLCLVLLLFFMLVMPVSAFQLVGSGSIAEAPPTGDTPIVQEDFDSMSDTAHLSEQSGWALVDGGVYNNIRVCNATGTAGSVMSYKYADYTCVRSTETYDADQYAWGELLIVAGSEAIGVAVRCQSGAATYYAIVYGGTNLVLNSYSAGTKTEIVSAAKSYSTGHKIRLNVTGEGAATRLTAQEDTGSGWANVVTMTDINPATDIDGGTPGVAGVGGDTCNNSQKISNFEAGNL